MCGKASRFELRPFDPLYGPVVASWVRDRRELAWVAPGTTWPLTAAKVVGWTGPTDRPLLLFAGGEALPCGYAELNPLRDSANQLWIGHLVIDPARRGDGLGRQITRMLVARAFADARIDRVVMIVFPDNAAAVRCYEANGFRGTKREEHCFGPDRRRHSLLRMEITRGEATHVRSSTAAQGLPV